MKEKENTRLDSWKEIAEYLGREVRTTIRWEKERELPVHRLPGGGLRHGVFAYTRELDAWLLGEQTLDEDQQVTSTPTKELTTDIPIALNHPKRARVRKGIIALTAAALLIFTGFYITIRNAKKSEVAMPVLTFSSVSYSKASPMGINAADLNGDGKLDLICAAAGGLSVMMGRGDGTFLPMNDYKMPGLDDLIVVGDFNRDGKIDVAGASMQGGGITVALGNGDGTFRAPLTLTSAGRSKGVIAGDFDGDGFLDLAAPIYDKNVVSVFLGRGDGSFSARKDSETGVGPSVPAAADLDGDGKLDLAVPNYASATASTAAILLGNGDGTFRQPIIHNTGKGPLQIVAGDVNHDGIMDLVSADFYHSVSVLMGQGHGVFAPAVKLKADSAPGSVELADMDGDGKLDIVVLNLHSNNVSILLNNGDGTFKTAINVPVGRYPNSLVIGDFNGDGKPDIAVANLLGNSIAVLLNTSNPH
jgi:hypothetical protein